MPTRHKLPVRPCEKVLVDGMVLEGDSSVDESTLTSRTMPASKAAGNSLYGDTANTSGALVMRADNVGSHAVLAGTVHMVAQAQRLRVSMQRTADQVSGCLFACVIAMSS